MVFLDMTFFYFAKIEPFSTYHPVSPAESLMKDKLYLIRWFFFLGFYFLIQFGGIRWDRIEGEETDQGRRGGLFIEAYLDKRTQQPNQKNTMFRLLDWKRQLESGLGFDNLQECGV